MERFQINSISENTVLIEFNEKNLLSANQFCTSFVQAIKLQEWTFIKDIIPAYKTVGIVIDRFLYKKNFPVKSVITHFTSIITPILVALKPNEIQEKTVIKIPVCYHLGLDLEEMAASKNITTEKIIELHTQEIYHVFMLGFLPGFPYMGSVVPILETPRKAVPRAKILAGSVGIAGMQTGIYPINSPGGWNIIGRTPINIFDIKKENPCFIAQGDSIQFYEIDREEFNKLNEYDEYFY